MDLKNMSNGKSDGVCLFYMKDSKLKTVALSKSDVEQLDVMMALIFTKDNPLTVCTPDLDIINKLIKGENPND